MRVNIHSEELTDRVTIVEEKVGKVTFTGLHFYLELPVTKNEKQIKGLNKTKRPVTIARNGPFAFLVPLTGANLILAATYVPTQLPVQYHRPCGA